MPMGKKVRLSALGLVVALALVSTVSLASGDFYWEYGDDRIFYGIEDGRLKFDIFPDISEYPIWVESRAAMELGTEFTIAYDLQNAGGYNGGYPFAAFDEAGNIVFMDDAHSPSDCDYHVFYYRNTQNKMNLIMVTTLWPDDEWRISDVFDASWNAHPYEWQVDGATLNLFIDGYLAGSVSDYIGTPVAYIRLGPGAASEGFTGSITLYYDDVRISGSSKVFSDHFNGSKLSRRKWIGGLEATFTPEEFNPKLGQTTTLSFWVPRIVGKVTITIHKGGEPVKHLFESEIYDFPGERYTISWDGRADNGEILPPGKYKAKIEFGDYTEEADYLGEIVFREKARVRIIE